MILARYQSMNHMLTEKETPMDQKPTATHFDVTCMDCPWRNGMVYTWDRAADLGVAHMTAQSHEVVWEEVSAQDLASALRMYGA